MTVQTFEALWRATPISRVESAANSATRATAEYWFKAGMENAAKVADNLSCGFHSPHEYEKDVADAIREAARGG